MKKEYNIKKNYKRGWVLKILIPFGLIVIGFLLAKDNYLIFHTFAELFSIVIAFSIFTFGWTLKNKLKSSYILILAISLFFVAIFDTLHTVTFKGMSLFENNSTNLAIKLWLTARYMEALTLFVATFYINKRVDTYRLFLFYSIISTILILSIFNFNIFPDCYIEGVGLTNFKIGSEYIISTLLIITIIMLHNKRELFEPNILKLIKIAIFITILSELTLTLYSDSYDIFNFIGHTLKIISFYFIYKIIIYNGFKNPIAIFTKEINEKNRTLLELEKAKYELKKSKEQLNHVIDGASLGYWDWYPKTGHHEVNDRWLKILGLNRSDIKNNESDWADRINPEDREKILPIIEKHIKNDEAYVVEFRMRHKNGKWVWIQGSGATTERDSISGEPIRISGIHQLIDDRKKYEEELKYNKNYLNTILDTINNIVIVSINGKALDRANRAFLNFFEYENIDEFKKEYKCIYKYFEKTQSDEFVYDGKEGLNWLEYIYKYPNRLHKVLIKKEDKNYIFSIYANLMKFDDKNRSIVVLNDITEIENYRNYLEKRVKEEIKKQQDKEQLLIQQSKMALMGEMIGAIAHQWRQPLNALGLLIQEIEFRYEDGEALKGEDLFEMSDKAMNQIDFMSKTIDDFRNFFKPNKRKKIFYVTTPIKNAIAILNAQLKNYRIDVNLIEKNNFQLNGYQSEFQQVILNLISNARDAIINEKEKKDFKGKIDIEIDIKGNYGVIDIRDNGEGIDENIIDRIFEPYFSTKPQGEGTGIGLYMSKIIIEKNMQGTLRLENREVGVSFIIEFYLIDEITSNK